MIFLLFIHLYFKYFSHLLQHRRKFHHSMDFFFFPFGRSHLLQQGTTREKGTTVLSDNASLGNRSNFLSYGEEKGALLICLNSERKL